MKQPKPLPTKPPFITFYTPTFRRPKQLAACLASVGKQTAVEDLDQIVLPDHPGYGLAGGLFGRMPWYQSAVRGRYVNVLCDDDILAADTVVEHVRKFAADQNFPAVIVTRVRKGTWDLPQCHPEGRPVLAKIDLTSYIVRNDVWQKHVLDYGLRYEGDFDHISKVYDAGHHFAYCDVLWAIGGQSNGRPEGDVV